MVSLVGLFIVVMLIAVFGLCQCGEKLLKPDANVGKTPKTRYQCREKLPYQILKSDKSPKKGFNAADAGVPKLNENVFYKYIFKVNLTWCKGSAPMHCLPAIAQARLHACTMK